VCNAYGDIKGKQGWHLALFIVLYLFLICFFKKNPFIGTRDAN